MSTSPMRIAILGSQGMLGTDLAQAFADLQPVLADMEQVDITDQAALETWFSSARPTLLINATGYTDVDGAEADEAKANAVNGEAVGLLGRLCASSGATLLHFSTEHVFDGESFEGYAEHDPVKPLNAYGRSKALGERLLAESGADCYLVRSSWLIGAAPQRGKPRGKNFLRAVLDQVAAGETVQVVNDQWGKPTFAADLAEAVRRLVTNGFKTGTYHLVNEGIATWYDLAREAATLRGFDLSLITPCLSSEYPAAAKRPRYGILRNTKFHALRPWQKALCDYVGVVC